MTVSFFGHARFQPTEEYTRKILEFLEDRIGDDSADLYFGGYGEFDAFAYECCKKYKSMHPNVKLIFVTPYMTLEYQRNHLEYQKMRYDAIVYPEIEHRPLKFAIFYRNRWMIEKADCAVFGITHDWGGAYTAYRYAKAQKKPMMNITGKEF